MHAWFRNWPEICTEFIYRMVLPFWLSFPVFLPSLSKGCGCLKLYPLILQVRSIAGFLSFYLFCVNLLWPAFRLIAIKNTWKVIPCIHFSKFWLLSRNSMFLFTLQSLQVVIFEYFVQSSSFLLVGVCLLGTYWATLEPELAVFLFWTY